MEDKPSTSNTEIVSEEISNANPEKMDSKSKRDKNLKKDEKRKSIFLFGGFFKKKDSPKAEKKLQKKSQSTDETRSISSKKTVKSKSESDIKLNNDVISIPVNDTTPTPDKDNKTTSYKDNNTTPDKDEKTTSDNEDVVVKILDEDTKSITINDSNQAISNNKNSTSDGDTQSISEKNGPSDTESLNGYESLSPLVSVSLTNNPDTNGHESTEEVRVLCESTAVTEDLTDDEVKLISEENEFNKNMERQVVVLSELVETEKTYIQDLSLMVDDIVVAMNNPETIGCNVQRSNRIHPNNLDSSEKVKLIFNNIKQIYEWYTE